jgi:hypothetical protein
MRIGAALIELYLPDADSLKARRRVARSVADRLRQRFRVSVAEVGDAGDRHHVRLGLALVGGEAPELRSRLDKMVRFVEALGLGELVAEDVVVARLDELEPEDEGDEAEDVAEWPESSAEEE